MTVTQHEYPGSFVPLLHTSAYHDILLRSSMHCKKHTKEVPMVDVTIDFIGHKVVIGHYCLLCYNFINKANPEVQMLRNLLIKNMSETSRQF